MRKNKLFLLLALLLTAATGAWATDYTTLAVGDVIKVGDTFTPTADGAFNDNGVHSGETYTLMRADVDNDYNVTEKTDGAYYVFKYDTFTYPYIHFEKAFAVTAISDGLEVTNIETIKGTLCYTLAVHESAAPSATTYSVKMKDGTVDAKNWSIASGEKSATGDAADGLTGLSEGDQVTLQYTGRLKVKGVKATSDAAQAVTWNTVELYALTADYTAQDGDKLTGTLGGNYKISIADGATVMLDGAVINGANDGSYTWAGLTLAGDGTIILAGENSVKGFYEDYPGIFVPANKTLTIQGDGSLTASSNGWGAGIGGGWNIACGNITIEGGTITATGGESAAGIGGGYNASCGDISITGGTINAQGGVNAAGIGGGGDTSCGNITIANTVTKVTATKGEDAPNSIGKGYGGSCDTVTIGGSVGAITESPYTYQP